MKCFFISAAFFIATFTNAQQQQVKPYLINVGTISPDAASLGRFGNIPVGYSTGLPGISIPVYEINVGKIKLPVSLDYHAGGIRVDEVSSSLGIGWALNCGGAITRNLAGFPDEGIWGFLGTDTPDPNLVNQNPQTYWKYLYDVTDGIADDTPDGFSYNFGNQNGKFTMKKGGGIFQIPVTNNRIESFYDTNGKMLFKITDENGLVYLFKKIETYTFGSVNNQQLIGPYTNVWRITHIIDQNTIDTVFFNYEDACGGYGFEKIRSFSYELGTKPSGLTINDVSELNQNTQMNSYTPVYLSSLTWRGGKIIFQNSCDRLDKVATEKRVTDISIYADDNGILSMIKKIKPFHSYFFNNSAAAAPFNYANSDERNYRLRLDSVGIFSSNLVDLPLKYRMTYDNTPMASRETYAQDAFGFNNGKFNNPNLLAKQLVQTGTVSSGAYNTKYLYIGDADRTADELYMKSCSITSISYPTGGRTEFELEPHQFSTGSFTRVTQSAYCAAAGGVQQNTSNTFVAGSDLENVRFNVFLPRYNYPSGVTGIPKATLTDQTTGQEILGISNMTAAQDLSISLNALLLVAGHTYIMNVNIYTTSITAMQGSFQILWEKPTAVMDIRKGGGLRVKTITDYSGGNTVSNKQVFNYGIGENGIGTMLTPYNYFSMNKKSIINRFGLMIQNPASLMMACILTYGYDTKVYSSGSLNPVSQFSGSPVLYTTVSKYEVDAANAKMNGKSIYNYNVFQDMPGLAAPDIKNTTMIQLFPSSWKNGFLKEETVYKSDGAGGFLLQEKKEYNYSESRTASITALKVVANYTDIGECVTRLASGISADLYWALYPINTGAYLLNSVVNTKNERAGQLTTSESFLYNATSHLFPTTQQTANSKAETVVQNFKYPVDLSAPGNVYEKMVSRNIISPVVESKQLNGSAQLSQTNVNYIDWNANTKLLLPQTIQLQIRSAPIETKINFNKFNNYGSIIEQQKSNDVKEVYLWGYKSMYPVAKILNTTSDIAKTYVTQSMLDYPSDDQALRTQLNSLRSIQGALVTTYTYKPLVGMTSQTDPNNRTTYYSYDAFNRRQLIKDQDGKIIKKICYNYTGQQEDCSVNVSPVWTATGNLRCATSGGVNTGYQEREERDNNANSPTFNQTQWVTNGYNVAACPLPAAPCSFTTGSGFGLITSGISSSAGVVSFYIVFYPTTTMNPGNSYMVATVNGGCKPSATRTVSYSSGGRNWSITIYPSGQMNWYLAPGSTSVSANSTIGTSTLTYNL